MYLKRVKIQNFRNFGTENNEIDFVNSEGIQRSVSTQSAEADTEGKEQGQENEINIASVTTLVVGKNNAGKTTIIKALDKLINTQGNHIFSARNSDIMKAHAIYYMLQLQGQ